MPVQLTRKPAIHCRRQPQGTNLEVTCASGTGAPSASAGTTTGPPAPATWTLRRPRPVSGSEGAVTAFIVHTLESVEEVEERMLRWPGSAMPPPESQSCRAGWYGRRRQRTETSKEPVQLPRNAAGAHWIG